MALTRKRVKGRREGPSFVQLPHVVINSPAFCSLKPRAVKLFIDLYGQYYGNNNGDFTAAFSVMKKRGWNSKDQLNKALKELLEKGIIVQTRQGWNNRCSLYAVTFKAIDECQGKLDMSPTVTALGWWKQGMPGE